LGCFFTFDDQGRVTGQKAVEDCAAVCAAELSFPDCKFCPDSISGFDFGVESSNNDQCEFCPHNDVLYPDKDFPLFGENVKCWQVQQFFKAVHVNSNAKNCKLAQMMNYVCGCQGDGYLGADTTTKKRALVWIPRIMAIISCLSSAFIIYDTCKDESHRNLLMNQLLSMLSVFDILGALGYMWTTTPIPEDYAFGPIYGANGTDFTCTAQGFFIQLGTISAYTNVSLAVYYMLVIVYGWSEERVYKHRYVFAFVPISIGLAFALAGLQHYAPLHIWCNNAADWWPDIPVAIAIAVATVIMTIICYSVSTKEAKTKKYFSRTSRQLSRSSSGGVSGNTTSLSSRVFWQSFWYLMAFYVTWPLYLALQYAWSAGTAFDRYGFILTAATMVYVYVLCVLHLRYSSIMSSKTVW
jgi:hypothetical protein